MCSVYVRNCDGLFVFCEQAMEPAPDLGDLPDDAASEKSSPSGATTPGRGQSKGLRKKELIKQGSVLSNYFNSGSARLG